MNDEYAIHVGDCIESMRSLPSGIAAACITSPPYFGLRDYGVDGQIGREATPDEFIAKLIAVFREVRRVLADDGTLWVNIGDSYNGSGKGPSGKGSKGNHTERQGFHSVATMVPGLKPKDLIGIPWMLAFALRADGWYLRSDIIWYKPNPMTESVRDRPTKAHEYLFLLSKSRHYFYDIDAIREPYTEKKGGRIIGRGIHDSSVVRGNDRSTSGGYPQAHGGRNKHSVWTVTTSPYKGAHFATFPPALVKPCILAGSRRGDVILDPFSGSGTTGAVAIELGRRYIGCELKPSYADLSHRRIGDAIAARHRAQAQLPLLEVAR